MPQKAIFIAFRGVHAPFFAPCLGANFFAKFGYVIYCLNPECFLLLSLILLRDVLIFYKGSVKKLYFHKYPIQQFLFQEGFYGNWSFLPNLKLR
jgi:hypothetical protein